MGIKGVYAEIGQGERISLSKLAVESIENKGRPLRIAIDISIWQFQNQAGKGGSNPALRTLYRRLVSLLKLGIQPIFVFDGPNKPPFKRNKRTGTSGPSVTDANTKTLLGHFQLPFHVAPGEGEAECALLQREGIVDAVLSEDVDTLMFGCGRTFRDWSSKQKKGDRTPTHVSVYDAEDIRKRIPGLDREGMVLIALMSGGDYNTGGIRQCGIKVACEAARAGFGKSLCGLSSSDDAGLEKWREELTHELHSNEKGYFRVKHTSLEVAPSFPDKEVLSYYAHPAVSSGNQIAKLKDRIKWGEVNVPCLRDFIASKFAWTGTFGARKFIRSLAPALITEMLLKGQGQIAGTEVVKGICKKRKHPSTDEVPELYLIYYPADVVGLDLSAEGNGCEDDGQDGLAPLEENGDVSASESEEEDLEDKSSRATGSMKRTRSKYDPLALNKVWVPETIVKLGLPLIVEDYEEAQRSPKKLKKAEKTSAAKGGMPNRAIERYTITIEKPRLNFRIMERSEGSRELSSRASGHLPMFLGPDLEHGRLGASPPCKVTEVRNVVTAKMQRPATRQKRPQSRPAATKRTTPSGNPWTTPNASSTGGHVRITKPAVSTGKSLPSLLPEKHLEGLDQDQSSSGFPKLSQPPRKKHSHFRTPPSSIAIASNSSRPLLVTASSLTRSSISFTSSTQNITSNMSNNPLQVMQPLRNVSSVRRPPQGNKKSFAPSRERSHLVSSQDVEPDLPKLPSESSITYQMPATQDLQQLRSESASINPICISSSSPSVVHTSPSPVRRILETSEFPKTTSLKANTEQKGSRRRFVVLRNSQEGVWKEVSDEEGKLTHENGNSRVWRASAVEVVDMTSDQIAERMQIQQS